MYMDLDLINYLRFHCLSPLICPLLKGTLFSTHFLMFNLSFFRPFTRERPLTSLVSGGNFHLDTQGLNPVISCIPDQLRPDISLPNTEPHGPDIGLPNPERYVQSNLTPWT